MHSYFLRGNNSMTNLAGGAPSFMSRPPQENHSTCPLSFLKLKPELFPTQVNLLMPAADLTLLSFVRWWGKDEGYQSEMISPGLNSKTKLNLSWQNIST